MAKKSHKSGISRRAYAKRRGVSDAAIRRRIADGTLADAILPDGTVDPDKCDALLAAGTTAGHRVSSDLATARRRKLAAGNALLADEIRMSEESTVPRVEADQAELAACRRIAQHLYKIAADAAPSVAGRPPAIAAATLQRFVRDALLDISRTRTKTKRTPARAVAHGTTLPMATATELATTRANLLARRLELKRLVTTGAYVEVEPWSGAIMGRMAIAKSRLLGIHVKLAPSLQSTDADGARRLIEKAAADVLAELASEAVSMAELKPIAA